MTKSYSRDAQPYLDAIAAAVRAEQSVRDWLVFQVATGRACRQILHKKPQYPDGQTAYARPQNYSTVNPLPASRCAEVKLYNSSRAKKDNGGLTSMSSGSPKRRLL